MALLVVVACYVVAFWLVTLAVKLPMGDEARLALQIFGGIGVLIVPAFVAAWISVRLTRAAIERVGREWCEEVGGEFRSVEVWKNHYVVNYLLDGEKHRRKFRVRFVFTTWRVRSVEWLKK